MAGPQAKGTSDGDDDGDNYARIAAQVRFELHHGTCCLSVDFAFHTPLPRLPALPTTSCSPPPFTVPGIGMDGSLAPRRQWLLALRDHKRGEALKVSCVQQQEGSDFSLRGERGSAISGSLLAQ